ncbi:hypothetical protein AMS68_001252 [Peltaster fructicola]|uniref:Haloacid dehalogenase-like hydrolase domain-containing protein 3 n=1 Tax=Peltaster fructicola TaxID=286661 RepID=A0A6H0XM78_9PEZI|nr:hypothetical protein AMS68_001252 [Peltaster fructicola]
MLPLSRMPARNILVCFDAFGTLFNPKTPVVHQYGEVARALGLRGFSDADLGAAFSAAFKNESKQNPNYGRATGLGAEKWWTNVTNQSLSSDLAPKLIRRFHCDEGYILYDDVKPLLHKLRVSAKRTKSNIVIGVITNSDDRVPDILRAFNLKVNDLRYGDRMKAPLASGDDIDFSIMSYDVGHEKPDRRIFDAAVETLSSIIAQSGAEVRAPQAESWSKIYIGDEYKKDVVGALSAGWSVALIDRDGSQSHDGVLQLSESHSSDLFDILETSRAVGARCLDDLTKRIPA